MEDDTNSWIRRAKYSHTICHRLDTSRLDPIPINIQSDQQNPKSEQNSTFQSEQNPKSEQNSTSEQNSKPEQNLRSSSEIQRNRIPSKQRSLSPLPQTFLNEVFREAKHEQKRFSTPGPRREKRVTGKLSNKESRESKASSSKTPPNGNSPSRKRKSKHRKEFSWTKYLENSGSGENVTSVETPEDYTVDMSKLFIGLRFAHGAHSRLYHGEYNGDPVAVKVIRVPEEEESGALASKLENQFTREVTLLSRLHHPNVIKFIAASRKPQVYCIITEYLSEGSLRAYLHKLERKTISLQKLVTFALDICRGMTYIHSQGFIHRDLKPENILINEDFRLIIADFGIACEEAVCELMADDPGTYRWMAPEMIKRKSYGRKVDVYGFGLILWEMLTGTVPYEDMNPIQAAFAVVNKKQRPVIPSDCPPAMRALIEQCWSLQPDKRPDFWQIVKVLEQFESSLAREGTLALVQNPCYQDQKKGLLHWIQKLGPVHQNNNGPVPKPKFI